MPMCVENHESADLSRTPHSSYYDKHYRQSPALIRARKPYLIPNILTGLGLCGVVVGIYTYTLKAVSQDEFEDVIVPNATAQTPHTPNVGVETAASQAALDARKTAARARS